jgi:predicted phage terminase large subunit-like protein
MSEATNWNKVLEFLEPKEALYCPHDPHPKQKAFLRTEVLEALFGGAAGGGKSDALLMAALQYVDTPGYAAMIFRNTFADLALPGAIMDRARDWLSEFPDVRWSKQSNTAIFPSGATISFGYLDGPDDHLRYKGMEVQFIGFDEVTEIREQHYRYLISRLRKPSSGPLSKVPLRARAATNPAPNWVRRYYIEEGMKKGRLYVPCKFDENPYIDQESYAEGLERLSDVDKARLKGGDWYAEETGNLFDRSDFKIIDPEDVPDTAFMNCVRYWDLAGSEPSDANPDPDYTVGAKVAIVDGYMIILDVRRFRGNTAEVESLVLQTAMEDGANIRVRMDQDPGQAGKAQVSHYGRNILLGFDFDGNPVTNNKGARVANWSAKAKRGEILLVRGDWITSFLDEAMAFNPLATKGSSIHDDQMDAVSGAFETLTGIKGKQRKRVEIIL